MANSTSSKKKKHKHWAIVGQGRPGSKKWQIDYDYVDKLTEEEKDFLTKFTAEYTMASFKHPKTIYKRKTARRAIYGKNNASNRCIMSLNKIKTSRVGMSVSAAVEGLRDGNNTTEDTLIELLEKSQNSKLVKK